MDDHLDELEDEGTRTSRQRRKPPVSQGGSAVYGLGLVGALVWYWRRAEEPADYVIGTLKALVWPAFLVYHAFEVLHGMKAQGGSDRP